MITYSCSRFNSEKLEYGSHNAVLQTKQTFPVFRLFSHFNDNRSKELMMCEVVIRIPFRKMLLSTKPYYNQKVVFDFPIVLCFSRFSDKTTNIYRLRPTFGAFRENNFWNSLTIRSFKFYQKFWRWAHYFNTWAGRGPLTGGTVVKVNERLGRLLLREDTKRRCWGRVMHEYLLPRKRRGPDVDVTGPRRIRKYNLLTGPPSANTITAPSSLNPAFPSEFAG